ncbi:MAG: histidinol-phosphate transaminase [Chloroflexi bacterium]|nr:histidinol-phosphate transaminase [Chloroflexota bacterium]
MTLQGCSVILRSNPMVIVEKKSTMLKDIRLNSHLLTVPAYIGGKPIEQVQEDYGLTDVIKLGSNENSLGPSPLAVAAFQDALQNAHRYPGIADKHLRQKLATCFNAAGGAPLSDANFMTANGLSDFLRQLAHAFLFDGGESIYCNPTFPLYPIFTKMFGGTPVAVLHRDFRYNLAAMGDAITERTRVMFICNPNNPTGTTVTRAEVETLMARVPPSIVVVFDESYYDFVDDPAYSNALDYVRAGQDNVIVLRSFSKVYGLANLRIGYAIATAPMIEYLQHAQIVFNTGDPVLRAAMAALDDTAHVQRVRRLVQTEREYLYRGFEELGLTCVPSQANFILLTQLPRDVKTLDRELLTRGIIVRPMGGFGMPDAIRVTIGTHPENERLLNALKEIL